MNSIPLRFQEQPESCVPACLRMVLAAHGLEQMEADIYACCRTDIDGTLASAAADCARSLGFDASAQRLNGLDSLRQHVEPVSYLPIAYINLAPIVGVNVIHAVVVASIDMQSKTIQVIDPAYAPIGHREWPLDLFEIGWRLA